MRLALRSAALLMPLASACAARSYTQYLLEPTPAVNPTLVEPVGTQVRPLGFGSTTALTVRWNDGAVLTEIEIPLLASGQRIVIAHDPARGGVETLPATRLVPPRPTAADAVLDAAYRERGLRVDTAAPEVSLSQARTRMQEAIAAGNYALALEWVALVLARYPSHPETLRAKGSILLLLGEKEKAIETWEAAEEISSDPGVREALDRLQRGP